MTTLKVGRRGFTLPVDMVTKTMGILAVKRAGKSNAAVVMAEEMFDAGVPWVAIDPKGDWWGIKAQGSHNSPGLPVVVFGGEHGEVPLEPSAGALVADLVVDTRLTCVLDVSEMTKADQRRFLTTFVSRLYQKNREPLHVFCEEADEYIPQRVPSGDTTLVSAFERLVKRGGFRGIGITLVTQRSASLNKDVLTQVGTLFAMRTTGPQDRKAIRDWVDWHDAGSDLVKELPKLAAGEAYVFSPEDLQTVEKIHFRARRTYDSGATPEVGKKIRPPANLAEVDLDAIRVAMAATIEKAEANDPKHLQRRITELEREVLRLKQVERELEILVDAQPATVEVPVFNAEAITVFETTMEQALRHMTKALAEPDVVERIPRPAPSLPRTAHVTPEPQATSKPAPAFVASARTSNGSGLKKAERLVLTALAQHGTLGIVQVATLTAYSHKGGGFKNTISALRTSGRIEGTDPISITQEGVDALGTYDPLPQGRDLLDWWLNHQAIGRAHKAILETLVLHYPQGCSPEDVASLTDYAANGGGFKNAVSRLRSLGLITGKEILKISPSLV